MLRFGDRIDAETLENPNPSTPRCANVAGVNVHANVCVPARDRQRLERLCRYVSRPPVASERLERLADGRLVDRLKHRWRDGTTHFVFEPQELIEKLAALIPPPRANMVRYHGVLAPASRRRRHIVPPGTGSIDPPCERDGLTSRNRAHGVVPSHRDGTATLSAATPPPIVVIDEDSSPSPGTRSRIRHYSWPELMQRVFAIDVLECPRCSGAMRILAAIHPPEAAPAILECLGLSSRPPPSAPARHEPGPYDSEDRWHESHEDG